MKAGYATLFGLVVAYSAYQGTGTLKPSSAQQESRMSGEVPKTLGGRHKSLPAGVEEFPTIDGGICPLTVDGGHTKPCGDCMAICPAKDLQGLIKDYFRAAPGNDQKFLEEHWNVPRADQANIQFVIASLPDPVHTHMALLFDRGIETLQSAAQASGFLFSRAWMPWDISTHNESPDFTVRLAQAKLRESMEALPGLLIFQRSDYGQDGKNPVQRVLFVFVVGETPTGGLRIEQFQNALKIRKSMLEGDPKLPETSVLRIYGPGFSGSLRSLAAILDAQRDNGFSRILIRSGSIGSAGAVEEFVESTQREFKNSPLESRPDFATFQFSDKYEEYYLGHFFSDREGLHSHIAVLSEDETAFGNQETKPVLSGTVNPCDREPRPPDCNFVRLYFPREIAQLRDAYQQNLKIQAGADGAKNERQNGLPLSLGVTGNDDDSVAAYSPLQTPLSQESILQAIIAALRKEHAKVVIIRAGDPLDMIFLSKYLRQNYPQARLVTVGADLLMAHDSYDPRFHGILAVTPYPLLAGTEFPSLDPSASDGKHAVQRLFPDSYTVGEFNAFSSLVAADAKCKSECLPAAGYVQFGLPSFLQPKGMKGGAGEWRAHLWLTAVGRDGYWPVAVLDDVQWKDEDQGNRPHTNIRTVDANANFSTPYSVHFTVAWTIFWMLTFGLTVVLAALMAYPRVFSRSEILARFGSFPSREGNCLLFSTSVLLLAAQTVFVFPAIVWLGRFAHIDEKLDVLTWVGEALNGMWLVTSGYVLSVVTLGVACYKGFKARKSVVFARLAAGICWAAAIVCVLFTWHMWSEKLKTGLGTFVYRYIHVDSGVSPALPLLFLVAAWIWWCWQSLTGVTSTKEKHMVLPNANNFDRDIPPEANAPSKKLVPEIADRLRLKSLAARPGVWPWKTLDAMPRTKKIVIPAVTGFLAIFLLMRPGEIAEAFESSAYRWMYWLSLYSCLFLVCYLVTQIVALWLEFRTLLRAIYNVPFRRGFNDLQSLTWKPLWKLAGNGRQDFVQLFGGEMLALEEIRKNVPQLGRLEQTIQDAKELMRAVTTAYEPIIDGKPETAGDVQGIFRALQHNVAACASEALIYANEQWKTEDYVPPAKKKGEDNDISAERFAKDATTRAVEAPAKDPTTRAIERFLCLFYVNIILVPLRRLQTLILAMAGVFVFVLISYSSYPFESRESFHVLLISIFFVISLVVGIVYGQMYGNPLLSCITNTEPGELGMDFWVRIGTFVFVPLLSLLSVQFPEINNFLFSWLQPALQSIK